MSENTEKRKPSNIVPDWVDPKAVRVWALSNGYKVGDRGRFSHEVIQAYIAAQSQAESITVS